MAKVRVNTIEGDDVWSPARLEQKRYHELVQMLKIRPSLREVLTEIEWVSALVCDWTDAMPDAFIAMKKKDQIALLEEVVARQHGTDQKAPVVPPAVTIGRNPSRLQRDQATLDSLLPQLTSLEKFIISLMWFRTTYTLFSELKKKWKGSKLAPSIDTINTGLKRTHRKLEVVTGVADIEISILLSDQKAILIFASETPGISEISSGQLADK